ncbi:MAG: hypothetical protein D6731_26090, partial [Planctomycetota bacterium]
PHRGASSVATAPPPGDGRDEGGGGAPTAAGAANRTEQGPLPDAAPPPLGLDDVFFGNASVAGETADLRYAFSLPDEAQDFEPPLPEKRSKREKALRSYLEGLPRSPPRRFRGLSPWSVQHGQLYVDGWGRRRLVAPFRADAPLRVEAEAVGARNLAVGLTNQGRRFLVVLGYALPLLAVAQAPPGVSAAWRTEVAKAGRRARERGPTLAVLRERGAFLHDELFLRRVRPRRGRNTLAFELDSAGQGKERRTTLRLRFGRRYLPVQLPAFAGRVELWVVALGTPYGLDELRVSGRLASDFLERARKAVAAAASRADLARWRKADFASRRKAAEEALKPKAPVDPALGR